jgi:catechol 2,3-dioxygenase-like lactoylglutathione lyase family enzyme
MLDHIGLTVTDFAKSRAFFDAALAPLGIGMIMEVTPEQTGGSSHLGYGSERRPYFWIGDAGPATGQVHVALTAADHASVDAFYAAAMAAGGRDNGPPGIRAHYHPDYYGAFVLDPDGHNIEAVCHAPQKI